MKRIFVAAALAVLAACAPPAPKEEAAAPAPSECVKVVKKTVAFTAPDAEDVIEARAFGADCRAGFIELTVRRADGKPLWLWGSAKSWLRIAPDQGEDANAPDPVEQFLQAWVNVGIDTTANLPDWPQRKTAFKDQLGAFMMTPFERDQYLDIRTKAAPRLCFAAGIDRGECIYYDPQTGEAMKVLETGG